MLCFAETTTAQIGNIIIKKQTTKIKKNTTISNLDKDLYRLSRIITKNAVTENEKSQAIFNWIATTITYDNELHHSKKLQKQFYTTEANVISQVLKRKKALCGGYALLYRELCESAGINAKIVHGYTDKMGGKPKITGTVNHTWNQVKLNGNWYVLDITWAISHGTPNKPNTFWYKTKPRDFYRSHLPEDANAGYAYSK